MSFEKIFHESEIILTEGALVERLKAEFNLTMDNAINHAGFIYEYPEILEKLYKQYICIGEKYNLPIMIMTPTRKVNNESLNKSPYRDKNILSDACSFLNKIKTTYNKYSDKILVGGLLGCKGNAYSGEKIMNIHDAYLFHKQQTKQFQYKNIDFLFAGIMPEINEVTGMAMAMAETEIPYIISFTIQKDGCLMDGTTLSDAIKIIDEQVFPKPFCYMTNCIHPSNLIEALNNEKNKNKPEMKRFCGIQANASVLSYKELDNSSVLHQNDFEIMADEMYFLKNQFGLKILGGCCGTNNEFIEMLTKKLTSIE